MAKIKHGLSGHPLYGVWHGMKSRCNNSNNYNWKHYGKRGIDICDQWSNNLIAFVEWALANGWKKGLQIDRKDNNGNYNPDNCRFVTAKVNMNNKRKSKYKKYRPFKYNGIIDRTKYIRISEFAKDINISKSYLYILIEKYNIDRYKVTGKGSCILESDAYRITEPKQITFI